MIAERCGTPPPPPPPIHTHTHAHHDSVSLSMLSWSTCIWSLVVLRQRSIYPNCKIYDIQEQSKMIKLII